MNATSAPDWYAPEQIRFGEDRCAVVVTDAGEDPGLLPGVLGIERGPVIVVCGGADDLTGAGQAKAALILGPAVSAAAAVAGAAVVDGGTASGVMELTGQARARRPDAMPVLLGVAPAGLVTYPGGPDGDRVPLQPDHSHFVLADAGEWGGETGLLIAVAAALAGGGSPVMVLAGGGQVATAEVLAAVRRGWPVFVISGTGGLADTLLRLWLPRHAPGRSLARRLLSGHIRAAAPLPVIADQDLREIIETDHLHPVSGEDPDQLARELAWQVQDEPVLRSAWQDFAAYDQQAAQLRRVFTRFQGSILALGVLATLLALVYDETHARALHWLVVAAPIVASVLIAVAARHAAGQRWVLLRGAAETIKAEIFRYRTSASPYNVPAGPARRPAQMLADRVGAVQSRLMQTEVSSNELKAYAGPLPPEMYGAGHDDDGLSPLDAGRYLSIRLRDQLAFYRGRARRMSRRRGQLQLLAIAVGGAGTLLAATGRDIWVGLTGGIAAASLAYLSYLQVDNTIVIYNQSAAKLSDLEVQWQALSPAERDAAAFEKLVTSAEDVLAAENAGWVQQMNEAMTELKHSQDAVARKSAPASADGKEAEPGR
jgi:SLOG in TRPM, prokaryote/SMODS and SLOG-associating 2TM effector domain 1/Protein of unknown function (DUF4231)